MPELLADILLRSAARAPDDPALVDQDTTYSYGALASAVRNAASGLRALGLKRRDRVAVYLEKRVETVVAMFAAALAGGVFVPVNPQLKARQVKHVLADSGARYLVTSGARLAALGDVPADCPDLSCKILVDGPADGGDAVWSDLLATRPPENPVWPVADQDIAALIYTSGSTGRPKGVMLSHRNLVAGARSVCQYLENRAGDRILCVLPFSFDYGLNQLTTALYAGATAVLMNYLLPRDIVNRVVGEKITGLACVPPLWGQLAALDWPAEAVGSLRYVTNTGGHLPRPVLDRLRRALPETRPYLMYGLTEAFRSTYLPPDQIDRRPDSIGIPIPGAEVMVVRDDGEPCAAGEPGELVHRGVHVALGYWNDPAATARVFRPWPVPAGDPMPPEPAVWSGDTVTRDAEGFLYFVGRRDAMIKTSGYRVSPTEVEEVVLESGLVGEVAAVGVPHPGLGQAILLVVTPPAVGPVRQDHLMAWCRRDLPSYLVPAAVVERADLPRNANGKIDRLALSSDFAGFFAEP